MKVLSIKQPFASLIIEGIKDIENRTWKLPEAIKGQRVLIHASSKLAAPINRLGGLMPMGLQRTNFEWYKYVWETDYVKSVIIGSVQIVDCVINHESIWAEKTDIPLIGDVCDDLKLLGRVVPPKKIIYNWVLKDPIKFKDPIPAKGKLRFWDYELETQPEIYVDLKEEYLKSYIETENNCFKNK
jgi:hypothetical protein